VAVDSEALLDAQMRLDDVNLRIKFAIAFIVWLSLGAFHVHEPLLAMWGLLGAGLLLVRVVR
jgi:hypothetical protein